MHSWHEDVTALMKAMYKRNTVFGRNAGWKRFYSPEYVAKVDAELIAAAKRVASWEEKDA